MAVKHEDKQELDTCISDPKPVAFLNLILLFLFARLAALRETEVRSCFFNFITNEPLFLTNANDNNTAFSCECKTAAAPCLDSMFFANLAYKNVMPAWK